MVNIELAKEMFREDYSSFVIKRSCAWQIHDLKRKSREKQHTVWVEMKWRLILYWLVKTIESI